MAAIVLPHFCFHQAQRTQSTLESRYAHSSKYDACCWNSGHGPLPRTSEDAKYSRSRSATAQTTMAVLIRPELHALAPSCAPPPHPSAHPVRDRADRDAGEWGQHHFTESSVDFSMSDNLLKCKANRRTVLILRTVESDCANYKKSVRYYFKGNV